MGQICSEGFFRVYRLGLAGSSLFEIRNRGLNVEDAIEILRVNQEAAKSEMVKMMLSQSRHVFKAAISSVVNSTTFPSFTFGARVRSILHLGASDSFRAFPFFSSNCSEVVAQIDGEVLLLRFLERLKNYEKEGVPTGAGTDSAAGFDLQRMERLLVRLGNPLSSYPVKLLWTNLT